MPDETTAGKEATVAGQSKGIDPYETLGVSKTASLKEIQAAYKKLALKYHPDRNQGSEEAAEQFKKVAMSYEILSDPNKRRQYDMGAPSESFDLEHVGQVARVFGAMFSRMGFSIQTEIGPSTLTAAQDICQNGIREDDPRVQPLPYGRPQAGHTERQQAMFFRLVLTEEHLTTGVVITCGSPNKSRFKLVVFDPDGSPRLCAESNTSTVDKRFTVANLLINCFETTAINAVSKLDPNDETPGVFRKLEGLVHQECQLVDGTHLLAVYGDNWIQKTSFVLTLLQAERNAAIEEPLKAVDRELLQKKVDLEALHLEFKDMKAKFEALIKRVEEETKATDQLVQKRDIAYDTFIDESFKKYRTPGVPDVPEPVGRDRRASAPRGQTTATNGLGGFLDIFASRK